MRTDRLLLLVACGFAPFAGCKRTPPAPSAPAAAAPTITVVKPERKPVKRLLELPGSAHAFEETVLYAKIPGYVRSLSTDPQKSAGPAHDRLIDLGSRVTKNQVLAELSVPELDEEFKQKEAVVRQSEAEVVQAKKGLAASTAGVAVARANVTEAKAGLSRVQSNYERWQSEVARVTKLAAGGVIDNQTRDETQNQFKSAEAGRNEAVAKITSAEAAAVKSEADRDKSSADVTAFEAKSDVAKADARRVTALLDYTRVKAPFDGIITRRTVGTGDFVTADGKQGLFAVARIDPVRVVVAVPEADAGSVTLGQEVRVSLQGAPGPGEKGTVARTSWSLEPGSRTLRVEIDLPNADSKVRPGTFVTARLASEIPAEWAVPAAAIGKANDEPAMYLAESGKAVRVAVQLLKGDGQFTQIRRYKRAGATEWTDITGGESIASPANAVSDGQSLREAP